jgi:hypothetical protein
MDLKEKLERLTKEHHDTIRSVVNALTNKFKQVGAETFLEEHGQGFIAIIKWPEGAKEHKMQLKVRVNYCTPLPHSDDQPINLYFKTVIEEILKLDHPIFSVGVHYNQPPGQEPIYCSQAAIKKFMFSIPVLIESDFGFED